MQTTYDYDDDGKQVMQQTVESHNASFLPCVGDRVARGRMAFANTLQVIVDRSS